MLKTSASFVLASLRGSTYRGVRLATSLAAALLDGHFEHPAMIYTLRQARPEFIEGLGPNGLLTKAV
jgi:hypothetical protein